MAGGMAGGMEDWEIAVEAAQSRQAVDLVVLDIKQVSTFTDTFVLCTGLNAPQVQAISNAIERALKQDGARAIGIEGYQNAEWVLMDYGYFLVHIFSPRAREFYDLERLWKRAPRIPVPDAA